MCSKYTYNNVAVPLKAIDFTVNLFSQITSLSPGAPQDEPRTPVVNKTLFEILSIISGSSQPHMIAGTSSLNLCTSEGAFINILQPFGATHSSGEIISKADSSGDETFLFGL